MFIEELGLILILTVMIMNVGLIFYILEKVKVMLKK